ncbi:hypothetical protein F183_A00260 [Bryobacterales bacterium F-183]|nr:hypothetical protein F183_A00260 [Bryobacterales bacterium F-183]
MRFPSIRFWALALKVWREARAAFLGCFFLVSLNSWLAVDRMRDAVERGRAVNPSTFDLYDGSIRVWAIAYAVLGAGSLLWERRLGGQAFTRVLPVRELHVNMMRALMGTVLAVVLASAPSMLMNAIHEFFFPEFVIPKSVSFLTISIALGIAGYGCSMLGGSLVSNFWAGIAVGWMLPTLLSGLFSIMPSTRPFAPIQVLRSYGANPPASADWAVVGGYLGAGIAAMLAASYLAEWRLARRFRP